MFFPFTQVEKLVSAHQSNFAYKNNYRWSLGPWFWRTASSPSRSLLLSYCFLHRKYSGVERECRQGDRMLALNKTPLQQWLEPDQVFWPGRSLHIIELAFVLPDSTPVVHIVQYIKCRQQSPAEAGLLSEQRLPSGRSCDLLLKTSPPPPGPQYPGTCSPTESTQWNGSAGRRCVHGPKYAEKVQI